MALVKSDGNGGYCIPRWFAWLVPVALGLAGLAVGWGVAWGTMQTAFSDHIDRAEIHTTHSTLKDEFASKAEVGAALRALDERTRRIEEMLARHDARTQ
jgi:Tfp pilus assembly protein PilO